MIRRRLLNLLTVLSLLLCVATVALWVRSYFISDLFQWSRPSWGGFVETADGEFRLELLSQADGTADRLYSGCAHRTHEVDGSGVFPDRIPGERLHFRGGGFALVTGMRWGQYHHALFLPAWFLATALAAPVVVRLMTRENGQRQGLCPCCGYDLRATPDRCPECGSKNSDVISN